MWAPNAGGVGKNCVFRSFEKSQAQTPYRRKFVLPHHPPRWSTDVNTRCQLDSNCDQQTSVTTTVVDNTAYNSASAPSRARCAGGVIRSVINNCGGNWSLLITVTVQLTSIRLVVWKSVHDTLGIDACTKLGSGIKRSSCWKYFYRLTRDLFALFVQQ